MDFEEDRELVRRCIAGEEEAWRALVERTAADAAGGVRRVLLRFGCPSGPAEVEETVLAAYTKLWENGRRRLQSWRGEGTLSAWVAGVARGEAIHHGWRWRRRREREQEALHEQVSSGETFPQDRLEWREDLKTALESLSEEDRLLLKWLYEEHQTYRQAAARLRIPWTTLASRVSRLKETLASFLRNGLTCL